MRGAAFLILATVLGAQTASRAQSPDMTVGELVEKAVSRDELLHQRHLALKCDQTIRTERLDAAGNVIKSKVVHIVHYPTASITFSTTMEDKASSTDGDTAKAQHVMAVMNLRKLAPRFQLALLPRERLRGRDCYVLSFFPKPGQHADSREEKVINNLKGRFWIAVDDFSIMQSEGNLAGPVTVALIASVNQLDFKFYVTQLPDGEDGPGTFTITMAVSAPFYDFRQRQTTLTENWRPQ